MSTVMRVGGFQPLNRGKGDKMAFRRGGRRGGFKRRGRRGFKRRGGFKMKRRGRAGRVRIGFRM